MRARCSLSWTVTPSSSPPCCGCATISGLAPLRPHLDKQPPCRTVCRPGLAQPVKRIGRDLGEAPARQRAGLCRAFLDDIRTLRAPGLLAKDVSRRIDPGDAPGLDRRIVDPDRGAIPVAGDRKHGRALPLRKTRNHPDVLDGPAL